jgi:hypothetical protein
LKETETEATLTNGFTTLNDRLRTLITKYTVLGTRNQRRLFKRMISLKTISDKKVSQSSDDGSKSSKVIHC